MYLKGSFYIHNYIEYIWDEIEYTWDMTEVETKDIAHLIECGFTFKSTFNGKIILSSGCKSTKFCGPGIHVYTDTLTLTIINVPCDVDALITLLCRV